MGALWEGKGREENWRVGWKREGKE